ncbi:coiled-coil domain-containing protein 1-like [Asterias rubens]|uniref:coiled-coil domain-containing protein 1-like n=1 Tax=Asterias rubens TaxID=7604 RepID=UPI001455106D|nr:coiled-coil domain-containing protein 1-like [Asterias rubens]
MECKAMLPDSTQSETVPEAANPPPTSHGASSGSSTKKKMNETSKKKKKRKSEDKTSQSSKKKKLSKEKSHKDKNKKSKMAPMDVKKSDPVEPDSDVDLENDVKPIRDYIKNRELMLQHMFKSVIKANKLQAMLPEILKGLAIENLKSLCLIQLEGMSKSRIASILAGEEMQSSSEDEESDSDIEKVLRRRDDKKDVINSEVIDSTSVLPHALPVTVDVEEDKSVHEEAAGEEAIQGDSEDENDADEEGASADESWQNETTRDDGDVEEKMECRQDEEVDENENAEPTEEEEEEEEKEVVVGGDSQEEELFVEVKKPKKFRRIKIVPTAGEEFEEGELTSDEVETDEESVVSTKEEVEELLRLEGDEQMDEDQETSHGVAVSVEDEVTQETEESQPKTIPTNAEDSLANQGNQDNDSDTGDNDDAIDSVDIKTNIEKDVTTDDMLNVLAGEDNFDIDAKESSKLVETDDSVDDSDRDAGSNDAEDDVSVNDEVDIDVQSEIDNDIDDGSNANETNKNVVDIANLGKVQEPSERPQPSQVASLGATPAKSGRKVAQELEVLELELRARAIRSLMKQYGKDVG